MKGVHVVYYALNNLLPSACALSLNTIIFIIAQLTRGHTTYIILYKCNIHTHNFIMYKLLPFDHSS